MTWCFPELPFVRRSRYDRIRRENSELRKALKMAGDELTFLGRQLDLLRSGTIFAISALDRIKNGASA